MKRLLLAFSVSAALSLQAATTDPVGVVTTTLPAHDGSGTTNKVFSANLTQSQVFSGSVDIVSGSTLTVSGADFTPLNLNASDPLGHPLHYVEWISGTLEGLTMPISSSTSDTLDLSETLDGIIVVGDRFNIRPYTTIGDLFSPDNSRYSLESSANPNEADSIFVVDNLGNFQQFYFRTSAAFAGGTGWRQVGDSFTNVAEAVIPDDAVIILRSGTQPRGPITLENIGDVKVSDQRIPINPGTNVVSFAFPITRNLDQINLGPGNLNSSASTDLADLVYLADDQGSFNAYYYRTSAPFAGGTGWRSVGDAFTNQGPLVEINPGDAIIIIRKGTSGFNWTFPKPY